MRLWVSMCTFSRMVKLLRLAIWFITSYGLAWSTTNDAKKPHVPLTSFINCLYVGWHLFQYREGRHRDLAQCTPTDEMLTNCTTPLKLCAKRLLLNQSINQSINRLINWSIDQSVNHSIIIHVAWLLDCRSTFRYLAH